MSAYSRMNLKNEHNNSFNWNKFRLRYEGATLYECIPSTIHLLMEKNEEKSKLKWKINELKNKEFIFALVRFLSPRFDIWRLRSSGQFFSLWLNYCDSVCLQAYVSVCSHRCDQGRNPNQSNCIITLLNPPLFHRIMKTCVKRLGWQMTASASHCKKKKKNPASLSRDWSGYLSARTQPINVPLA